MVILCLCICLPARLRLHWEGISRYFSLPSEYVGKTQGVVLLLSVCCENAQSVGWWEGKEKIKYSSMHLTYVFSM